jgi:hypothetical protein
MGISKFQNKTTFLHPGNFHKNIKINQIQKETARFQVFQNPERTAGFHKKN